jgi:hypothetical protein
MLCPQIICAHIRMEKQPVWTTEHRIETPAAPDAIWALLADVDGWQRWNDGVEAIALRGPFAVGSTFTMTPAGGEEVVTTITVVDAPRAYVDETELGGIVVRVSHLLDPLPAGGTALTFRLDVDGPGADEAGPEIGPAISADFPEVMATLAALAADR